MRDRAIVWTCSLLLFVATPLRAQELKLLHTVRHGDGDWGGDYAALSPDCKVLVTDRAVREGDQIDKRLQLWDVATGKLRGTLPGFEVYLLGAAFSPDGKRLVTCGGRGKLQVWDIAGQKELEAFEGVADAPRNLAFSADGRTLAGVEWNSVARWDAATGKKTLSVKRIPSRDEAVFSPDLKTLAAPNHQEIELWDMETKKPRAYLEQRGHITCVAYSRDGKTLVAASCWHVEDDPLNYVGEIRLWDPVKGKERLQMKDIAGSVEALALSPDGATLAVITQKSRDSEEREAKLLDVKTGRIQVLKKWDNQQYSSLHYSPEGVLHLLQIQVADKEVNLYVVKK
jgi:WD40 repeat protein